MKRTDLRKILIIGSGPIVIGQGCEFDYSGVQAVKALKSLGYEVVLVNSNPATVMTDPDLADRTYIEPLTCDYLHEVIRRERPDALLPTLGGQTALNLAMELEKSGVLKRYRVELIGANAAAIERAEDRNLFKASMREIGLDMPRSGSAHSLAEAEAIQAMIGSWPLIVRPGFTLGGTGGGIAHDAAEFARIVESGLEASLNHEVLVEESLIGWKEYEMEVMRDKAGNAVIVCSIENMDPMGALLDELKTLCAYPTPEPEPVKAIVVGVDEQVKDSALQSIKALFGRFFAKSKTGRVAFSRAALAKLCEVSERTIYNWDTGATAPEIDGYSEALRIGGGTEMFAWIEDYRRFKQRPQLGKVLTRKNIAFLDGITDKDKELIQEYIRTHRVA